jgi:uncharacterized caspase-like protein
MRRAILTLLAALPLLLTSLLGTTATAHAAGQDGGERRIALVIGNADYDFAPLKNPVNDAEAMAQALEKLGFKVIKRENGKLGEMLEAIREFSLKASSNDVRLLYYAGHGVQIDGKNYLIPVDADIHSDDDFPRKSVDMSELVNRLGRLDSGLNILILDACRNNPFKNVGYKTADGRFIRLRGGGRPGLARVDAPQGTLVAFSTAPGAAAMDGRGSANSLYTRHLLENISVPGLPVEQLFKRVRIAVAQETRRMQIPWESSSLMGDFCFRRSPAGTCEPGEQGLGMRF